MRKRALEGIRYDKILVYTLAVIAGLLLVAFTANGQPVQSPNSPSIQAKHFESVDLTAVSYRAIDVSPDTARQPKKAKVSKTEFCDSKCKSSIAVYIFGSAMDLQSSIGKKELNPLARGSNGLLSPAKGVLLKSIPLGLSLAFQNKHPTLCFWLRTLSGIAYGGVAVRNWQIPKAVGLGGSPPLEDDPFPKQRRRK